MCPTFGITECLKTNNKLYKQFQHYSVKMPESTTNKDSKKIIGLTEKITIFGEKEKISKKVIARIDTGATKSSIDVSLAAEIKIGPILKTKLIKSASGSTMRPIVMATVELAGKKLEAEFSIADRNHMKYPILIGQNILIEDFLVDCSKQAD